MPAVFYQFVSHLQVESCLLNFTLNQILISGLLRLSINCLGYAILTDRNNKFMSTVLNLSDC